MNPERPVENNQENGTELPALAETLKQKGVDPEKVETALNAFVEIQRKLHDSIWKVPAHERSDGAVCASRNAASSSATSALSEGGCVRFVQRQRTQRESSHVIADAAGPATLQANPEDRVKGAAMADRRTLTTSSTKSYAWECGVAGLRRFHPIPC